jgi:signal transduction histidine kinase
MNVPDHRTIPTKEQIIAMLDKAYALRGSLIQNSISLTRDALEMSREKGDKQCISRSLSILSLCLMVTGEYTESMAAAEEAINLYEELGDDRGVADAKYNIAGIYYKTDNPNIGLVFLKECLETYQSIEDYHNMARVYKSMGTIFEYFDDQKSAIYAYEQSIEAGIAAGDPNLESNAYNPLSGIYLNSGQEIRAMDMIQKSIDMKQQTGDTRGLGFALYGRGKVYAKMGYHKEAEVDYLRALEIHKKARDPLGIGMVYNKLAELYISMEDLTKAKSIIDNNLVRSNSGSKIKLISFKSYYYLYLIAKKEGDHQSALEYLEKHHKEKETVINSRTLKIIESYETISRMKGLEHEAETQKEKASIIQKKNLELDSFFYRVSHDLKVPINAMKRLEFMMREEAQNQNSLELVKGLSEEVKNVEQILDELIKISRVNHMSEIKEEIDFEKMIADCISSYQYLVNFDAVQINYKIQKGVELRAEWALVNAAIQNLIENAINFADLQKLKPMVSIEVTMNDKEVMIQVEDNGVGIVQERKEMISDMFYRPNKHIQNAGMGLFIIYRAVENLKAKLDFESEEGKGSIFRILIPR